MEKNAMDIIQLILQNLLMRYNTMQRHFWNYFI